MSSFDGIGNVTLLQPLPYLELVELMKRSTSSSPIAAASRRRRRRSASPCW